VAGDVDADTVRKYAEETYGKVPRGAELPPRNRPQEPVQNTRRTVTLNDPRITVPSFSKKWVVPSYESAAPGVAESLDLLAEILGGGVRSRLYQDLIVEKGIAASAGAYYQGTALDPSSFGVYGSPLGGAKLADVEKATDAEIARVAKDGVSEEELAKAKKRFVRGMVFARDNQAGMARLYGGTLATGGTVKDVEEWPKRIDAVTAEQVKEAAAKYLDPSRSVTGYLLPPETGTN
jgi:zinc protease